MQCKVKYSPEFQNDLDKIWEYIALELSNLSAADDIVPGLLDVTEKLYENPEAGRRIFLPGGMESGYRFVIYKQYLAIYCIREKDVLVLRAVHTLQDYIRTIITNKFI